MKFILSIAALVNTATSTKILSPPTLIAHSDLKLFHEGPIYDPELGTVLISSDILDNSDPQRPVSGSTILDLFTGNLTTIYSDSTKIPYANGGVLTTSGYIICGQGDFDRPSGLYLLNPLTMISKPLVTDYQNFNFNSLNDIVIRDNQVYFTDPDYGMEAGFRHKSRNTPGVYKAFFDPQTQRLNNVERILKHHWFDKPNGIAISLDGKTLLVTDSGYFGGDGSIDSNLPRYIYAWDMNALDQSGRLVYKTEVGIPDGIKFDDQGRLWVGNYAGEGILQVDYKTGKVLAKIPVEGGSANFAFVGRGMIIMGDQNLWMHKLDDLE